MANPVLAESPPERPKSNEPIKLATPHMDVGSVLEFFEPGKEGTVHGYKAKRWTVEEEAAVREAFKRAADLAPGLVESARLGSKIQLIRVSSVRQQGHAYNIVAATWAGKIFFPDNFFKHDSKVDTVLHELLHIRDAAGRYSYSKEWIAFAQPALSQYRLNKVLGIRSASDPGIEKTLNTFGEAGSESLRESFAYYFSKRICGKTNADNATVDLMLKRLLQPAAVELAFARYYYNGMIARDSGKCDEAVKDCQLANNFGPTTPQSHLELCFSMLDKDIEQAVLEASMAWSLLDANGVAVGEPDRGYILAVRALLLSKKQKYAEAKSLLDSAIAKCPGSTFLFGYRASINEELGRYGSAAADLYLAQNPGASLPFSVLTLPKDTSETFKLLDQSSALDGRRLYRKAQICKALGDVETDARKRKDYYMLALRSLRRGLEYRDCRLSSALFEGAQISLKMNNSKAADNYRQALIDINETAAAKVIDLQFLEYAQKNDEAKKNYPTVKRQLRPIKKPTQKEIIDGLEQFGEQIF